MHEQIAPVCEPVRRPDDEPEPETLATIDLDNLETFRPVQVWVN